jgi:nitrogen regulatory protein P-II 2
MSQRHITIIVKAFKSQQVIEILQTHSVQDLIVYECRGYGRQKGHLELYSGPEYTISFVPKVCIECSASRFDLEAIFDDVQLTARTGRIGDGKIFVEEIFPALSA